MTLAIPESLEQNQLLELEAAASTLAERYKSTGKVPPCFVEFAGSPKSGKSTAIDTLHHFFRRMGFSVTAQTEGASKRTPVTLKDDLVAFNTWSLNYAISEMLLASNAVTPPHLVLLDRGPFDALAWMQLLTTGKATDEVRSHLLRDLEPLTLGELKAVEEFAMHPRWQKLISRLYIFTCSPEVSLERETHAKLTQKSGRTMNPAVLNALKDQYAHLHKRFSAVGVPLAMVETSSVESAQLVAFSIARDLLQEMSALAERCAP